MEKLTKAEEPIMKILWDLQSAFVKDIVEQMPNPKPPYNTVSSIVRILVKKGFVNYKAYGKTYEYKPAISKTDYKKFELKNLKSSYFGNSTRQLVSFLVEKEDLSKEEIEEIKKIIDQNTPKP